MEDSPPPFITFHSSEPAQKVYRRALALIEHVHKILEDATAARYYHKDQLERMTTAIALELARAARDVPSARWQVYRPVLRNVTDVATMLDILERKSVRGAPLVEAQAEVRALIEELTPLALERKR